MKLEKPYGLNAELEFAKTIIASGWLKGCRPLSGLIISQPDTGKSESLMCFNGCKGVLVVNDLTAYGITRLIEDLKSAHHLVIPDLLRVLERSPRVANEVISMLNIMSEEGLQRISTFNIQIHLEKPLRRGFLTSLTLEAFNRRRKHWRGIGFTSRPVPFFFGYNEEDLARARETIRRSEGVFKPVSLKLKEPIEVDICDKYSQEIERIAVFMGSINDDFTAFRTLRNAITMAKARAALRGRSEVEEEDIKFMKAMVPFWFNPIVGNDCDYYIIHCLPARTGEIVRELEDHYSERTIYYRLEKLHEKKVIYKKDDVWYTTY